MRKVTFACPSYTTMCVCSFFVPSIEMKHRLLFGSGNRPSHCRRVCNELHLVPRITECSPLVLAIIQEKVNNPSPDDPFEPDIAAVRLVSS